MAPKNKSAPIAAPSIKDRLRERIEDFSGQRRKVAEYIVTRPGEVAVYSLRKVASRARVSPGTLVTLAKDLGFGSYNAFRARVQQEEMGVLDYFSAGAKALQEGEKTKGVASESGGLIEKVIRSDLKNIGVMTDGSYFAKLASAATLIRDAKRIFVIGRRASFGVMHYFYYTAQLVREEVHLVDDSWSMAVDQISRVGPNDVIVSCGFYPYVRTAVELVAQADARGAKVVCFTDAEASPLSGRKGVVIPLPRESPWLFGSVAAALVATQAVLAHLTALGGEAVLARVRERERVLAQMKVFAL